MHIDLGVDNGIYVWLDGNFIFGALAPGGSNLNEYDIDLTGLSAGSHSLQILREDHGGATGFDILVDVAPSTVNIPEPGSLLLMMGIVVGYLCRRHFIKK